MSSTASDLTPPVWPVNVSSLICFRLKAVSRSSLPTSCTQYASQLPLSCLLLSMARTSLCPSSPTTIMFLLP